MTEKESKVFAEILNRLREGKHNTNYILKTKERIISQKNATDDYPMHVLHLFIQNAKVNEFNEGPIMQQLV